jgi:hypothetical protein
MAMTFGIRPSRRPSRRHIKLKVEPYDVISMLTPLHRTHAVFDHDAPQAHDAPAHESANAPRRRAKAD